MGRLTGSAGVELRPAPLPLRACVLGSLAVLFWVAATVALVVDVLAGRSPYAAGGFSLTVGLSLLWVLVDSPTAYRMEPGSVVVVTRVRSIHIPCVAVCRVAGVGRDRFAINGGFGWFGWFSLEGALVRAWVTDPEHAVRVTTGGRDVLISPVEGSEQEGGQAQVSR